jgi:hypothetical protein
MPSHYLLESSDYLVLEDSGLYILEGSTPTDIFGLITLQVGGYMAPIGIHGNVDPPAGATFSAAVTVNLLGSVDYYAPSVALVSSATIQAEGHVLKPPGSDLTQTMVMSRSDLIKSNIVGDPTLSPESSKGDLKKFEDIANRLLDKFPDLK